MSWPILCNVLCGIKYQKRSYFPVDNMRDSGVSIDNLWNRWHFL